MEHLTLFEDDSSGYCVHAYNAVSVNGRWIKPDVRGNKEGVNAQFSMTDPLPAYPPRKEHSEYIWNVFAVPVDVNGNSLILIFHKQNANIT